MAGTSSRRCVIQVVECIKCINDFGTTLCFEGEQIAHVDSAMGSDQMMRNVTAILQFDEELT